MGGLLEVRVSVESKMMLKQVRFSIDLIEYAVLDYIGDKKNPYIDQDKILIFGRSLGGAVAFRLGHDNPNKVNTERVVRERFADPRSHGGKYFL